jgi:hypothetical protein
MRFLLPGGGEMVGVKMPLLACQTKEEEPARGSPSSLSLLKVSGTEQQANPQNLLYRYCTGDRVPCKLIITRFCQGLQP